MAVRVVVDLIGCWDYVVLLRYDRMKCSMSDLAAPFHHTNLFMVGRGRTVEWSGSGTDRRSRSGMPLERDWCDQAVSDRSELFLICNLATG